MASHTMDRKRLIKIIMYLMLVLGLMMNYSCKTKRHLLSDIQEHKAEFPYVTPTRLLTKSDSPDAMNCQVVFKTSIPDTTSVHKDKYWCVPLVFFSIWEAQHTLTNGADLFEGNVLSHFQELLSSSVNSKSHYPLAAKPNARFKLVLEVDSIKSNAFYTCNGDYLFLPLGPYIYTCWSEQEYLGPIASDIYSHFSLYDGSQLVYNGHCVTSDFLPTFYSYKDMKDNKLYELFVKGIAQSLDNCMYGMSNYVVSQSNMVLDIHNDVNLRVKSLHND